MQNYRWASVIYIINNIYACIVVMYVHIYNGFMCKLSDNFKKGIIVFVSYRSIHRRMTRLITYFDVYNHRQAQKPHTDHKR